MFLAQRRMRHVPHAWLSTLVVVGLIGGAAI